MFTVTWIVNGKIQSVSHPTERIIMQLWFALRSQGRKVRMWNPEKKLVV